MIELLKKTELQKVLNYHIVKLNYPKIKIFTFDNFKSIIKEILIKYNLWNKYENLIEDYICYINFPLDLRFMISQQIKYTVILKDNSDLEKINSELILDLQVLNISKNNC